MANVPDTYGFVQSPAGIPDNTLRVPMSTLSRRAFVLSTVAGVQVALAGCGGGSSAAQDAAPSSAQPGSVPGQVQSRSSVPAWSLQDSFALVLGSNAQIDLRATLPNAVVRGGRFEVDPSGSPLPADVVLQSEGLITLGASAAAGVIQQVVFAYIEP
jgi:hypothetical protein